MATINNQRFVSADVIAYELGQVYKSKSWDIGNVRTWCAEVETQRIKDVGTMTQYLKIDLTVNNGMVLLPCNVFRVYDLYEGSNKMLEYNTNGAYLYDIRFNGVKQNYPDGSKLYINYVGTNIDVNTGEILIVKGHEIACKTLCKINMFEEDAAFGKFDKNLIEVWKQELSGQVLAAKYNVQHKSRKQIDNLNKIRGNMLVSIAGLSLHHELYK
jgi:hypothetical protein